MIEQIIIVIGSVIFFSIILWGIDPLKNKRKVKRVNKEHEDKIWAIGFIQGILIFSLISGFGIYFWKYTKPFTTVEAVVNYLTLGMGVIALCSFIVMWHFLSLMVKRK